MIKNIKISTYPYGKITKRLQKAVVWLNKNKIKIHSKSQSDEYSYCDFFDYPDYWKMPKKISNYLSGDEVDWMQAETYDWWQK